MARGCAVAESAMTLTLRYAVGADPFPVGMSRTEAERRFIERMAAVALPVAEQLSPKHPEVSPTS